MEELRNISEQTKKHFLKLLSDLHNSSNTVVFKALTQLRVDASKDKSADKILCEINAFKVLIKFLKLPNDKILSVTLSILANCSLKDYCRKQIDESGIVPPLVSILKHIGQDSIQNRACRLAANLALSKDIAIELYEHKIVPAIMGIIDTSKSSGTLQSAIRALRIICESSKNSIAGVDLRDIMLAEGAIKSVAGKLVSENKEVIQNTLKCIALFSEHSPSICTDQLRSLDNGAFCKLLTLLPDPLACQIIYNLCRCPRGISYLNENHAVQWIISLLLLPENQNEKLLIYSLCLLCNDCSGSMKLLTCENGLNVFLCLLDRADNYSIKSKLYNVLLKFTFEPQILLRLTKFGLVKILVNKLDSFISTNGKLHKSIDGLIKEERKEEKWACPILSAESSLMSESNLSGKISRTKFSQSSPIQSGASPYSSNSGSISPSHSYPQSLSPPLSEDSSPLAVYSPVCSIGEDDLDNNYNMIISDDSDSDDGQNECEVEDTSTYFPDVHAINPNLADITSDNSIINNSKTDTAKESVKEEDYYISYILLKLSHVDATVDDLASERTIEMLLKYLSQVQRLSNAYVVNFFRSLVVKEQYYCDLLDNQFALRVHRNLCRPVHSKCSRCDGLNETGNFILEESSKLSESGLGEGQMAYRLLTGQNDVKLQVALTVPYVSRNAQLLLKHLFNYKAMDLLFEQLLMYNRITSTLVEDIAYGVKILFVKLNFENPQEKNVVNRCCEGCDIGKLRKESSIIFSLDDGTIVPANKTSLCTNSPVFDAMLNGNFKESEQHEVKICDVSEKCLQHFVKLVDTYCECILPSDVNVLLELISVSDRYLVSKLMNNILEYVMNYILNHKNCQIIYKWSKECKLPFSEKISSEVIKFIFTSKMSCKQLRKAVTLMMDGMYRDNFVKDIIEMIKDAIYRESRKKFRK